VRIQLPGLFRSAVFKKEGRLNLCVPGGKETARMLKALYAEMENPAPAAPAAPAVKAPTNGDAKVAPAAVPVPSRDHPAEATFLCRTRLNKPGSNKETWHVEFDLGGSGLDYAVGDSFGICPLNDPALADE
jgi:sulfite reductase (NADPH) flavoprotein alpha-component